MAQTPAIIRQAAHAVPFDHTPGSAVAAGDVVIIGSNITVAPTAIAAGILGATLGANLVVDLPKTTGSINVGTTVCWSASGNPVTGTAGTGAASHATGTRAGTATAQAASGDSYVRTLLAYSIS